jgi:hypothetical protein
MRVVAIAGITNIIWERETMRKSKATSSSKKIA